MLTAAEWNERYPDGTPVHYDGQVWTTVGGAGPAAGADGAWLTLRGCGLSIGPRDVPVDAVEPLFTDAERVLAGWLDPARAQAWTQSAQRALDAARAWASSRSPVERHDMDDDEERLEAVVKALDNG